MSHAILVNVAGTISIKSDYDRNFAYVARMHGGTWNKAEKLWQFDATRYDIANLRNLAGQFYDSAEIADAFPVALAPEATPVVDHGHIGTVGAKLTVCVTVTKVSDFANKYGAMRCHTMVNEHGHVLTWFASTARHEVGEVLRLQGTVKKHDTYKGVSQTVLTRCKKLAVRKPRLPGT